MTSKDPSLDGTLGAVEIGTVIGTFLFGILTLQTFNYYRQFSQDSRLLKNTIAILWLLELGHTICSLHGIYWITVTTYDRLPNAWIAVPPQSLIVIRIFTGGIEGLVQVFFGNRIRMLSGRLYVFFLCITLTILELTCDVVLITNIWRHGLSILQSKVRWEMIMALTIGPVGDFIIAYSMCYYLWHIRESGLEFRRTRTIVDTLVVWTVETTLVTGVAGAMQLILFLTRTDLVFGVFYIIQPKLFSNSMLAVLNGRARFRSPEHFDHTLGSGLMFDSEGTRNHRGGQSALNIHEVAIQMPSREDAEAAPAKVALQM